MQSQAYQQEELTRVSLNDGSRLPDIDFRALSVYGTVIGGGGFGRVFKYQRNGVTLAVKDIALMESTSTETNHRILRESEIHSGLRHPNVVALHYTNKAPGRLLLVMEYADGGSLLSVLRKSFQSLELSTLLEWATQIADGMSYLHQSRIVHRDLKPDNVLLKKSLNHQEKHAIKICDFGFARDGHQQTTTMSNFKGTIGYMAPEVTGDPHCFSKFSDVWSYGVTLWQMLTGRNPYEGIGLVTVHEVNVEDLPTYQLLIRLLQKCWNYFREERPTFESIVRDLVEMRNQILLGDKRSFQGFGKWFWDHTAPQQALFNAAQAAFLIQEKCRDICMTKDGHFLIAADASGLLEFSESGLQLSCWPQPARSVAALVVEATHDQHAVVGTFNNLTLIRHAAKETGGTVWTEVRQFPLLNMHPSSLAIYGDIIAVSRMLTTEIQLISLSSGLDLTSSAPEFGFEIKNVALTDQLIVAVSYHQLPLSNGKFANVVEAQRRSGDRQPLWRYKVRDSDEVTDVCADDRFVYIALKRNDKRMVTAISALHGTELVSNAIVSDALPVLPFKLSLGKAQQHNVLVVLSDLSTVTPGNAVWKVTVHQGVYL